MRELIREKDSVDSFPIIPLKLMPAVKEEAFLEEEPRELDELLVWLALSIELLLFILRHPLSGHPIATAFFWLSV